MFSKQDFQQLSQKGITVEQLEAQIKNFENGFAFSRIQRTALVGDGIVSLQQEEVSEYCSLYEKGISHKHVLKFVPASGAASRMFKALFAYLQNGEEMPEEVATFFERIDDFPFYKDLVGLGASDQLIATKRYKEILSALLESSGLNYGKLPKGLLKFHAYPKGARTPVEEHFVEGALFAKNHDGSVDLHFTVSPEHLDGFQNHIKEIKPRYESEFNVTYEVSFSEQKPYTDTIAVDLNNKPFRNSDGSLLFRPGGHGALLENLNDLQGDFVFIKNIDNVVSDELKEDTITYKKVLGGVLLQFQTRVFEFLDRLDQGSSDNLLKEISSFLENELCTLPPPNWQGLAKEEKVKYLRQKLNRPIRVCGMVINTGEPGGGPFWVKNSDGSISLQVVESPQINMNDTEQKKLVDASTHFNPTDLVCALRDYKGNKFDLLQFRDLSAGFITLKSKDGKELKAQELPGLWNGSMADWNTIFVEVPISTFNPVKTVNDLLRRAHQVTK